MKLIPIDCTNGNILEQFPEFAEIWKHPYHEQFVEATNNYINDPDDSEILLIQNDNFDIVGITGWWPITHTIAGLRWHGIVPHVRGDGISSRAMLMLVNRLKRIKFQPYNYTSLVEICGSQTTADYFIKLGFVENTDQEFKNMVIESCGGDVGESIILVLHFMDEYK